MSLTSARLSDFRFEVPDELIAQRPATPRDSSRLMVVRRESGTISHHVFRELPELLDESYAVVVNDSRVIDCKLDVRVTPGRTEAMYLLERDGHQRWSVSGDWLADVPRGSTLDIGSASVSARLERVREDGLAEIAFTGDRVEEELSRLATVPLPPYITETSAADRYQTIYADEDGSVAAPTAGLHFTDDVFRGLDATGVERLEITLHVGYGTFAHVEHDDLTRHAMHSERYKLDEATADRLTSVKRDGRRLLATGTTATRTLESCVGDDGTFSPGEGATDIFIYPPYRFKAVDALLTNFHMPGLTPIMLVAAFAGRDLTMEAYRIAIDERYRFYSFGDAMLLL